MSTEQTSSRREVSATGSTAPGSTANRELKLAEDLCQYLREYAREKPEVVAMWSFGIGFILGWKLKPW